ncbi:MAG TPA: hypothetical protein VN181_04195 [Thermoanaerobaculia bacterium]|nr:hypothetical protein [Thermoanaerobaculia bacterium]
MTDDVLLVGIGSVGLETVAVFVIGTDDPVSSRTRNVNVNVAVGVAIGKAPVQLIVPPPPTPGKEQGSDGPLVCEPEKKVISGGTVSVSVTVAASFGPLFVTVMLYATSEPTSAVAGPVFRTLMSDTVTCASAAGALMAATATAIERNRRKIFIIQTRKSFYAQSTELASALRTL